MRGDTPMAKHCTNCGHELRETDKFCAECGTAVEGGAPQSKPTQWEYCEVDTVDGKAKFLASAQHHWVATVVGRNGMYEVAKSERLPGWPTDPLGNDVFGHRKTLQAFIQKLVADGWEPIQGRGSSGGIISSAAR